MADTADTAVSSSPANQAERQQEAAPVDEAQRQQNAASADHAQRQQNAASADHGERQQDGAPADQGERQQDGARADEAEEPHDAPSVSELFEELGRALKDLGASEAQLETARHLPEVRRAARETAGALIMVAAALTAFALLNVAAVAGLSDILATWLAALVLAVVWIVIGGLLFFGVMGGARRWLLWIVVKEPPSEAVEDLEQERDAAGADARSTLEQLGPALATQIALAAVPKAEEVAGDVAVGVIEVGDSVLDASDEIVEVVTEQLPGGGLVNQVWAVALRPGRFGIRIATTVLRRGRPQA